MILTLATLFLVLIGVALILIFDDCDEMWFAGVCIALIVGIGLLCCIGAISTREIQVGAHIVKIEAVRNTVEYARTNEDISPFELAAIQQKVAEKNEWIADAKYWTRHPLTSWFWSRRILEIEPIK